MEVSSDYEDLLRIFNRRRVKYLVVGAYAVIRYTEPRHTKDIDIWIKAEPLNAKRVFAALTEFGAPLIDIGEKLFTEKDMIYQIGVAPVRVDILMGIEGLNFDTCWAKREKVKYGNVKVNFIDMGSLIRAKSISKRDKDKADAEILRQAKKIIKNRRGGRK